MTKQQRIAQLRRRTALLIFTVLLIAVLSILGFAFSSKAQSDSEHLNKYYKSISIEYGSTLYDIALEYSNSDVCTIEAYINEVRHINHLSEDDNIYSGQLLIVPYYSTEFHL